MVLATFDNIAISADGSTHLVLLRTEKQAIIPIAVSAEQALSIVVGHNPEKFERPLTHDLLLSVIDMLYATIKRIEICDLQDGVFYGQLVLENRAIEYDIDARPSDLLAIAVRSDAPIFIAESVVEQMAFEDISDSNFSVEA